MTDEVPNFETPEEEHAFFFSRLQSKIQAAIDEYAATPYQHDTEATSVVFPADWIFIVELLRQDGGKHVLSISNNGASVHTVLGLLDREKTRCRLMVEDEFRANQHPDND